MTTRQAEESSLDCTAIELWSIPLDIGDQARAAITQVLTDDDRKRAATLRFAHDRQRFEVSRASLRVLLGRHLGEDPRGLRFELEDHGKPRLAGSFPVRFSASRSHAMGLICLSSVGQVGVDLEFVVDIPESTDLAAQYFTPREASHVAAAAPACRSRRFLEYWTRKEAYVKGLGIGLRLPLDTFEVSLHAGATDVQPRIATATGGMHWKTAGVRLTSSGYVAAVALRPPPELEAPGPADMRAQEFRCGSNPLLSSTSAALGRAR